MTRSRSITAAIQRLRKLTIAELVCEYEDLHGKPPRSRNHAWLWRRCAWKLQERELGGLSQTAKLKLDELIDAIEIPNATKSRTVASTMSQGRGRPRSVAPRTTPAMTPTRPRSSLPPVGTSIVRRWRDRDLRLTILDDGVEVDGSYYSSLTAAAFAVTGSKWNGRLFWLGKGRGR